MEKALLTTIGIALIIATIGPISEEIKAIEEKRNENCLNTALRSVDLAITNSLGGGIAEGYAFLPVKVVYECNGREVKLTAGDRSVMMSYPFRLVCGGEAYLAGKFHASWRRDTEGEAVLILSWSGVRG